MARYKVFRNPQNGYTERVKDGYNWVVLFLGPFGPLWHLFSGFVGQGLAWFLVACVAGMATFGIGAVVVWIIAGAKANETREKNYLRNGWIYLGYEDEVIRRAIEQRRLQE